MLLKRTTVEEMVRPQLTGEQRRVAGVPDGPVPTTGWMVPDFLRGGCRWTTASAGSSTWRTSPGKRSKGSLMWAGGLCNGHWFVDPYVRVWGDALHQHPAAARRCRVDGVGRAGAGSLRRLVAISWAVMKGNTIQLTLPRLRRAISIHAWCGISYAGRSPTYYR